MPVMIPLHHHHHHHTRMLSPPLSTTTTPQCSHLPVMLYARGWRGVAAPEPEQACYSLGTIKDPVLD